MAMLIFDLHKGHKSPSLSTAVIHSPLSSQEKIESKEGKEGICAAAGRRAGRVFW